MLNTMQQTALLYVVEITIHFFLNDSLPMTKFWFHNFFFSWKKAIVLPLGKFLNCFCNKKKKQTNKKQNKDKERLITLSEIYRLVKVLFRIVWEPSRARIFKSTKPPARGRWSPTQDEGGACVEAVCIDPTTFSVYRVPCGTPFLP